MPIRNFLHKGLKKLYWEDDARRLPAEVIERLRAMLSFLQDMKDPETLRAFPSWRAHQLSGDRAGQWSLHVTKNWRLIFRFEDEEVVDVNYEDYH